MLTGQSTVQKPTAKSLPQAARGCFLASPSRMCRSVVSTADARLVFQHTLIESKHLAPARSSHGVAWKTMKRRILILASRLYNNTLASSYISDYYRVVLGRTTMDFDA